MQHFIVLAALAVAVFYIGRRLWFTLRNKKNLSCGCGCSGCSSSDSCDSTKTIVHR